MYRKMYRKKDSESGGRIRRSNRRVREQRAGIQAERVRTSSRVQVTCEYVVLILVLYCLLVPRRSSSARVWWAACVRRKIQRCMQRCHCTRSLCRARRTCSCSRTRIRIGNVPVCNLVMYFTSMYAKQRKAQRNATQRNERTHQMRPRRRFAVAKLAVVLINRIVMCVHANCTHVPLAFSFTFTFTFKGYS